MPYELEDENGARYRLPASVHLAQRHVGGSPRVRVVRAYGSTKWFTVLDAIREPATMDLVGVIQTDRDDAGVQELLDEIEDAAVAAVRLHHVDHLGGDVEHWELLGSLPMTVSPDGVDGSRLTVTVPLVPKRASLTPEVDSGGESGYEPGPGPGPDPDPDPDPYDPYYEPPEWTLNENSPVISGNTYGFASIVYDAGTYIAYVHGTDDRIDRYTSPDGISWTHTGEVLAASETWEGFRVGVPQVWKEGGDWFMLYRGGASSTTDSTGLANSSDGITWTKYAGNPVLSPGPNATWDRGAELTSPIKVGGDYYAYYESAVRWGAVTDRALGIATSTDLESWTKDTDRNPVIGPEHGGVFCPFVWNHSGLYYMLLPRYTDLNTSPNEGVLDLYRSPRPTFYREEREYLGTIWESTDDLPAVPDTPWIVHTGIDNTQRVQPGLKVYFATGATTHDGLYLLEHPDAEVALDCLEGHAIMHSSETDWNEGTITDLDTTPFDHDLVLEAVETPLVNQSVDAATGGSVGTDLRHAIGNTFTTVNAVNGFTIEAMVYVSGGTPASRLKCSVYAVNTGTGLPTGDPLAVAFTWHTASGWARFHFPDVTLAASTKYAYAVGPEFAEASNYYAVRGDNGANSYAGGNYVFYSIPLLAWSQNTAWDATFRVILHGVAGGEGEGTFESAEVDLAASGTATGVTRISWASVEPEDTSITVEVALSTDGGNSWGSWTPVSNGGSIPGISASADLTDYRLKYRATLTSTDPGKSPRLERVLVEVQRQ